MLARRTYRLWALRSEPGQWLGGGLTTRAARRSWSQVYQIRNEQTNPAPEDGARGHDNRERVKRRELLFSIAA